MTVKIVDARTGKVNKEELPPNMKLVNFSYTDENGAIYGGDFVFKRLTIGDIRRMAVRRAQLNGSFPENVIDEDVAYMNIMLGHLEVATVKAPDWWKPDDLYDPQIVLNLYKEVLAFEASFRRALQKRPAAAPQSGEEQPVNQPGADQAVVGQEVPTPADA